MTTAADRRVGGAEIIGLAFTVLVCSTVWIPWSVSVRGLNLRLSQIALPLVLLVVVRKPPTFLVPRRALLLTGLAVFFVGSIALWTVLAPDSDLHAFGRVGLLALNVLQMAAGYMLVARTRRPLAFLRTFIFSVAALNVVFLVLAAGVTMGLLPTFGMVELAVQPSIVAGQVSNVMAWRIEAGGVLAGCYSAGALAAGLAVGPQRLARSKLLALLAGLSLGAGVIVGFSRQALLSLAVGVLVVLGAAAIAGRFKTLLRVAAALTTIAVGSVALASVLPGLQGYLDAFAGRAAQLADVGSYSVGTARDRTEMWGMMLHDISANPLKGRGQDAYMRYYPSSTGGGSHNLFVEALHAGGLLAFLAVVLLHGIGLASGVGVLMRVRRSPDDLAAVTGVLSCTVATMLAATTNLIYWSAPYWFVLGWLLALGRAYPRRSAGSPGEPRPGPLVTTLR